MSALVVDDNATNRKILRQQLQSWGVTVAEAVDGFEALGLATAAADAGQLFDLAVIPYAGVFVLAAFAIAGLGLAVITRFGSTTGWSFGDLNW